MQMNKITWSSVGVLFPTIDTSQFPLHRVCHKELEALWRGPRWCFKRTRCGGNSRVLMVGNNTVGADLSCKLLVCFELHQEIRSKQYSRCRFIVHTADLSALRACSGIRSSRLPPPYHQPRTYLTLAKVLQPHSIEIITYYTGTGE